MLIAAAWIYHEIDTLVQARAKKIKTVSDQIVDRTYDEIKGKREKERNTDND